MFAAMAFRDSIYELVIRGARPLATAVAPLNAKLKRGVDGQRQALDRFAAWKRKPGVPLVWVHAPSVGEGLMAQAIVRSLRARVPDTQIAFTHFSPSAERMRESIGADISGYLPWDTEREMARALALLQPNAIAFVRSEIWPTLVRLASEHAISSLLVNAVLAPESSRLGWAGRFALQPAYQRLSAVGAVDATTAERYQRLGLAADTIRVTGDARFDQVWQRVRSLDRNSALLNRLRDVDVLTIVAGSTWPSDEELLLPAFARIAATQPMRLIVAAHEPDAAHLQQQEAIATQLGLRHARLSTIESNTDTLPQVILVDRVGVLADLYAIADLAYVGGAFRRAGVHSVVEPAALGVPCIFGPQHANAVEAAGLIESGGGRSVRDGTGLNAALEHFANQMRDRKIASEQARLFVESRLGGADANAALIQSALVRNG
jgi:3-deoxy-D-manno-octulosonic-acid transferase